MIFIDVGGDIYTSAIPAIMLHSMILPYIVYLILEKASLKSEQEMGIVIFKALQNHCYYI